MRPSAGVDCFTCARLLLVLSAGTWPFVCAFYSARLHFRWYGELYHQALALYGDSAPSERDIRIATGCLFAMSALAAIVTWTGLWMGRRTVTVVAALGLACLLCAVAGLTSLRTAAFLQHTDHMPTEEIVELVYLTFAIVFLFVGSMLFARDAPKQK